MAGGDNQIGDIVYGIQFFRIEVKKPFTLGKKFNLSFRGTGLPDILPPAYSCQGFRGLVLVEYAPLPAIFSFLKKP